MTDKDKKQSVPPPSPELDEAKKEFAEACEATDVASKKHKAAVQGLQRTISDPQFRAVRQPTPSQLELEAPPAKR